MSEFPTLRTGAVAQYPMERQTVYATDVMRFIDGEEQRSRSFAGSLRRWVVRLDLVDEGELAAIETLFEEMQGTLGTFAFTDPWDGTVYPNCSLDAGQLRLRLDGPGSGRAAITIRENRS